MNLKEKVEFICKHTPGTLAEIAMMVPCHVNTLKKVKSGDEDIRLATAKRIDALYNKALKVRAILES